MEFYFQQKVADKIKFQDIEYLFEAVVEPDYPEDTYNEDFTFTGYFGQLVVTLRLELYGSKKGTRCNFTMTDGATFENHFWLDGITHIWREDDELCFFEENAKRLIMRFGSKISIVQEDGFRDYWK